MDSTSDPNLDIVWRALADPTRRAILDALREGPRRTSDIVALFPELSRFAVMKHVGVLKDANLVLEGRDDGDGRVVTNKLNVIPIRQIYERWVSPFEDLWAGQLLQLKEHAEREG